MESGLLRGPRESLVVVLRKRPQIYGGSYLHYLTGPRGKNPNQKVIQRRVNNWAAQDLKKLETLWLWM